MPKVSKSEIKSGVLESLGAYNRRYDLSFSIGGVITQINDIVLQGSIWYAPVSVPLTFPAHTNPVGNPNWKVITNPSTYGRVLEYTQDILSTFHSSVDPLVSNLETVSNDASALEDTLSGVQSNITATQELYNTALTAVNSFTSAIDFISVWSGIKATGVYPGVHITASALTVQDVDAWECTLLNLVDVTLNLKVSGLNGVEVGYPIPPNTWYNVYVVYNPTTNTIGCMASYRDEADVVWPTGFTQHRLVCVTKSNMYINGVVSFSQIQNEVYFSEDLFSGTYDSVVSLEDLVPNPSPSNASSTRVFVTADAGQYLMRDGEGTIVSDTTLRLEDYNVRGMELDFTIYPEQGMCTFEYICSETPPRQVSMYIRSVTFQIPS